MELLERFVPLFVAVLTAVTPIVLTIHSSGRKDRAQGKENSEKLYAIRNEMNKDDVKPAQYDPVMYSRAPAVVEKSSMVDRYSGFLRAVYGKDSRAAWTIMDDLMDTLNIVNRKIYDSVMRKFAAL